MNSSWRWRSRSRWTGAAAAVPLTAAQPVKTADLTTEGSSDMARPQDGHLWGLAQAERAALAEDLAPSADSEDMPPCAGNGTWSRWSPTSPRREPRPMAVTAPACARREFRPDVHNNDTFAGAAAAPGRDAGCRRRCRRRRDPPASSISRPAYLGEDHRHAQDIPPALELARTPTSRHADASGQLLHPDASFTRVPAEPTV